MKISFYWKSLPAFICCALLLISSCSTVEPELHRSEFWQNLLLTYDDYYQGYIGIVGANHPDRYLYIIRDEAGRKVQTEDEAQRCYLKYYRAQERYLIEGWEKGLRNIGLAITNVIIFPMPLTRMAFNMNKRRYYTNGVRFLEGNRNKSAVESFERALGTYKKKKKKEETQAKVEDMWGTEDIPDKVVKKESLLRPEPTKKRGVWLRDGTDIHFRLGLAYERLGEKTKAIDHYRIFLDYSTGVNRFPYCSDPPASQRLPDLLYTAKKRIVELEAHF